MVAPLIRRFTRVLPLALNAFLPALDDETGLTFIRVTKGGVMILDVVNDPDPAAGLTYTIAIFKAGVDTGRRFYTTSLTPLSAGRISVGPIDLSPGDYFFQVAQTAGALAATSFVVKFNTVPS